MEDQQDEEWGVGRIIVQLDTAGTTLSRADTVLKLARDGIEPEVLAACATALYAAALEQAVQRTIEYMFSQTSTDQGEEIPEGYMEKYKHLTRFNTPFRRRLIDLPGARTNGHYELNQSSKTVKTLFQVIATRNRLLHVRDQVEVLEGPFRVEESDDGTKLAVFQNLDLQYPKNPWIEGISIAEAEEFARAVRKFFEEMVDADGPREGEVLRSARPPC